VGRGLWQAKPDRPTLLALGLANAAGAVLLGAYLVVQSSEVTAYGIAVVAVAIVGLAVLAVAELALAREAGQEAFVA
jgi:hypothetical protein